MSLSHNPVGLIILNSKGIIQSINSDIEKMTGYDNRGVAGYEFEHLISGVDILEMGNGPVSGKLNQKDCDDTIDVDICSSRHLVDDKKLVTLIVRKKSEPCNDSQELERIREEAQLAVVKKNEFLARMSHEIRTPMNGIIGTVSLMEGTELSEKQMNYVHTIKSSGQSLLVILNEILDFSALEAGKVEAVNEPLDLYNCIDEIYHLFQAPIQEKGLKFNLEYNDIPEYIMGDHGRIRQVVINLINNALKFTDEGEITLKIVVYENDDSSKYLKFSIHDTGDGIAEDKLQELFKAFSQVDESSVRKAGGTGLGLSICKALAEVMGGEIGVESEIGKGSVFWFSIPLLISSDEDLQAVCNKQAKFEEHLTNLKYNASILLVDDVEVNRFVVSEMLEGYGCSINQAENGKIATEMAKEGDYDLIFMDCQMPVMDGFQAAKEIRKFDKDIPIIALTANVLVAEKDKCFDSGMNDFIAKPITKESFAPIFNQLLPHLVIDENSDCESKVEVTSGKTDDKKSNDMPVNIAFLEQFGEHVEKVIELTIKDADDLIFNIDEAIKSGNALDAGLEAHSLKSVMAQIGADKIADIAKKIELQGKSEELEGLEEFNNNLKLEYKIVTDFLRGYVGSHN